MRKAEFCLLLLIGVTLLTGCDALGMIETKEDARQYNSVTIHYDADDNPYYNVDVQRSIADQECISNDMKIQTGMDHSGIIEYTYYGGGLLSDPEGNIYYYDKDGFIYDKDGNPNSDKVIFRPSTADYCVGIQPKAGNYAKTFDKKPVDTGEGDPGSDNPAPIQANSSSGSAPDVFTANATCFGNVIWADFFPTAPDYNARAGFESLPISLSFDFENGLIESDFCGQGKKPNDGWAEGSADFCVSVKDSLLYQEIDGSWSFDGVWDVDLDMSAAQLHWVGTSEEWAYSNQNSHFDAPFHGWIEPGEGSLYTDEVQPATFQFLCDFVPLDKIFD